MTLTGAVVAIASGKGGVGKSTVTVNLGLALTQLGLRVGIIDADVYGPNVPAMLGLTRRRPSQSISLARASGKKRMPVERFGMKVMSAQFLIAENQAISFDATLVRLLVEGFVRDTDWGALDITLIDLPPGTADLQQNLANSFGLTAAVIVVTPQDVAHLDGRKAVAMFRSANIPIIGGVENMSTLRCPHCENEICVFPQVATERSIWADGIEKLVTVPLDPAVSDSAEAGEPVLLTNPQSALAAPFHALAQKVTEAVR